MQNLYEELVALLKSDKQLYSEDKLLKNKVVELALANDERLLEQLLTSKRLKERFFTKAGKVLVFQKDMFIRFVNNYSYLPGSYTAFKNKVGLQPNGKYLSDIDEVSLAWPFKDCILEGGMEKEDEKRDELFFNEILAPDDIDRLLEPKVLTDFKMITTKGEGEFDSFDRDESGVIKDNLIIKGNNLLVLHSLKPIFRNKVKLIYIDPPFNTGNDSFRYNDTFNHSTWLTFMKNRLEIGRDLLENTGTIAIHISNDEEAYLKVLCDEVFGRDNFINLITVETRAPSSFQTVNPGVYMTAEYLLLYAKDKRVWKHKPLFVECDYDANYKVYIPNVDEDSSKWKFQKLFDVVAKKEGYSSAATARKNMGPKQFLEAVGEFALNNASNVCRPTEISLTGAGKNTIKARDSSLKHPKKVIRLERETNGTRYIYQGKELTFYDKKTREIDGKRVPTKLLTDIWTDISWQGIASEGDVKLKKGKKPERLMKRLIELCTDDPDDIIMDYFLGTGTTAAVAHKMGYRYIGVEQIDYEDNDGVTRLRNVVAGDATGVSKAVNWGGGGKFVYCELARWNEKWIDEVKKAKSSGKLTKLWNQLKKKAFLNYRVEPKQIDDAIEEFSELSFADKKRFLVEILDKNHLYINLSDMEDKDYGVSKEDKDLNKIFYGLE